MSVLDDVIKMQKQGYTDEQIIQSLREKGVSPKDINNSLNQSQIKTAVNQEGMQESIMQKTKEISNQEGYPQQAYPQQNQKQSYQQQDYQQENQQQAYPPTPVAGEMQQTAEAQQAYPQDQSQEAYYPTESYSPQYSSENVSEIAEGIMTEKLVEVKKQATEFIRTSKLLQSQFTNLDERLKKIENTIDQLQMQIIGKISDYGKEIEDVNKEMRAMQNSFSKMINPVLDKKRQKTTKDKKDNFEKYLR